MVSESQKAAIQKWDRENMTSTTVRMTKKFKAEFESVCQQRGMSRHAAIKEALQEWMKK